MMIQAQISLYPLKTQSLSEPIEELVKIISNYDLKMEVSSMSTIVSGDSEELFQACRVAFDKLSEKYKIVLDLKISNACPLESRT